MPESSFLEIEVNGDRRYHRSNWRSAIYKFLNQSAASGGRICFGAREAGFVLSLTLGQKDCAIVLWTNEIAPKSHLIKGKILHSPSEWDYVTEYLRQFVDNSKIEMFVITNRWNPTQELRLWKKSNGTLGIAGTYPNH